MSLPSPQSLTLTVPRITYAKFLSLLQSHKSPAVSEALDMWNILLSQVVDPSFCLAQYRVESQMGTSGYALETHSIGNMLYDKNLTILASGKVTKTTSNGGKFTYATYTNYKNAIQDYCRYIHWYKDQYGLDTIYGATARWIGKDPGSAGHVSYVTTIINDMIEYEFPQGGYESGDKMIYFGAAFDRTTGKIVEKYPVVNGQTLYRGTNGDILKKYSGPTGAAWWLGFVNGGKDWGALVIGTSSADADATVVYIKSPDSSKIIKL